MKFTEPALLAVVLAACSPSHTDIDARPTPLTVRVAEVTAPGPRTVALHGVTRAADEAAASFAVPGRIASLQVSVGDTMRRGQTLGRLDARPLDSGVQALTGQRDALVAQRDQLARDVARLEQLGDLGGRRRGHRGWPPERARPWPPPTPGRGCGGRRWSAPPW